MGLQFSVSSPDLDECLSPLLNSCHQLANCINTIGSYRCECKIGYQGNGQKCNDIDECVISPFFCHPLFDCRNTDGSYICACPEGFEGNGDDCYGMLFSLYG
ncbi:Adhesion G protein-coupled receptor E2 [Holothuria leucospilota]|uniref:Adhesion G protein-coupled receptor E2 n=1 Tax=Holothuria leucospilota TaxID=206669 RepID=A0A9Q1C1E4_HOLLE|nr:Adhesion G protein-coupled receptor E2 [Holothuria leucospilota]